jgi:hypothetical protein
VIFGFLSVKTRPEQGVVDISIGVRRILPHWLRLDAPSGIQLVALRS